MFLRRQIALTLRHLRWPIRFLGAAGDNAAGAVSAPSEGAGVRASGGAAAAAGFATPERKPRGGGGGGDDEAADEAAAAASMAPSPIAAKDGMVCRLYARFPTPLPRSTPLTHIYTLLWLQRIARWTGGPTGAPWVQMELASGDPLCLFCGEVYPADVRGRLGHACCGEDCFVALKARYSLHLPSPRFLSR